MSGPHVLAHMVGLSADFTSTVATVIGAAIAGTGASIATGLLTRPRTKAQANNEDAAADEKRVLADLSMSKEAREWVAQAMQRVTAAERTADAERAKADKEEAKADAAARAARHSQDQLRLACRWADDLSAQVTQLGGHPLPAPAGLEGTTRDDPRPQEPR